MDREKIKDIVYKAIDKINEGLPESQRLPKLPETCLFGDQGLLDSLGLVNLIVGLEKTLSKETGVFIALAQKRSLKNSINPFSTIGSLIDHIDLLWKDKFDEQPEIRRA